MKKNLVYLFILLHLFSSSSSAQSGTVDQFKKAFYDHLQLLIPAGYEKRTVKFISVIQGANTGGFQNFKVTAYVHDYEEGYPTNRYWGQTCWTKIDGLNYTMRKDAFGEWLVQGRFTVLEPKNHDCKDNVAQGVAFFPLDGLPGNVYNPSAVNTTTKTTATKQTTNAGQLYIGEYACYGTGGRLMAGMGFILLPGGKYYDVDKGRGGSYVYNAGTATISFVGGFLSGQKGKNVTMDGFQISNTVRAEPWK